MIRCPSFRQLSFTGNRFLARGLCGVFGASLVLVVFQSVHGGDWPQTLGPARNGASNTRGLAEKWPKQFQPKWTVTLGSGYAGPAVVDSMVLIPHRIADQEKLSAFDLDTGQRLWDTSWKATYSGGYNSDHGPRCVPTVSEGKAIVYGAAGDLQCVRVTDGKLLWGRRLRQEYKADDGYFGAGSAPLVIGDLVVVCLGGKGAGVIAVDLSTGKNRWTATSYEASYAAPIDVSSGGMRRILVVTRLNTLLIDAETGNVLADVDFGVPGPTVNAATPIRMDSDSVLLTASYNIGAALFKIKGDQLVEVFRDARLLASQYNTPVKVNEKLIGIHGREDGTARLRAVDVLSRKVLWDQGGYRTAHLIALGSQVLSLANEGHLELIDGNADSYQVVASNDLPRGTYRALPALVDKQLLVRRNDDQASSLMLIELP